LVFFTAKRPEITDSKNRIMTAHQKQNQCLIH
jgi:hypothetical protein